MQGNAYETRERSYYGVECMQSVVETRRYGGGLVCRSSLFAQVAVPRLPRLPCSGKFGDASHIQRPTLTFQRQSGDALNFVNLEQTVRLHAASTFCPHRCRARPRLVEGY